MRVGGVLTQCVPQVLLRPNAGRRAYPGRTSARRLERPESFSGRHGAKAGGRSRSVAPGAEEVGEVVRQGVELEPDDIRAERHAHESRVHFTACFPSLILRIGTTRLQSSRNASISDIPDSLAALAPSRRQDRSPVRLRPARVIPPKQLLAHLGEAESTGIRPVVPAPRKEPHPHRTHTILTHEARDAPA
jgi:hypothetical protein